MATVGDQLLAPEVGWVRYEDTDSNIGYLNGTWTHAGADPASYTNSTASYSTALGATIKIRFRGTKVRIITYATSSHSNNVTYTLDGVNTVVSHNSSMIKTIIFERLDLVDGLHELTMTNNQSDYYMTLDAIDLDSVTGSLEHWLLDTKTSISQMQIGDRISFKYIATANTFGSITELGSSTDTNIPVIGASAPIGTAYFIMVGYDLLGRIKLVCDRNIQHSITWDSLNTAGVASASGLPISIDGKSGFTLRLPTGGINTADFDNEWDKIVVEDTLNGTITAGDNVVWNWTGVSSLCLNQPCTRGYNLVSGRWDVPTGTTNATIGFRPILLVDIKATSLLLVKDNKAYSTVSGVLTEVSANFTALTNIEKQALFTSSEIPALADLKALINFDILAFSESGVSNKVVISEVPFQTSLPTIYTPSIVAVPKSQFIYATGDIDFSNASNLDWIHINNGISNSVTGNSKAKYIFSVDKGVTWKTYKEGAFVDILDTANVLDGSIVGDRFIPTTEAMSRLLADGLDKATFDTLAWNDITIALNNRLIRFATIFDMDKSTDALFNDNLAYQYDGLSVWKQAVNGIDYEVRYNSPSKLEVKFITGDYKAKVNF